MTPDDLHRLDDRLRENERVTAALGAVQRVLVDSAKSYAPKDVVDKLDDLTRNEVVPKLAALTDRMENAPKTPLEQPSGFAAIWRPFADFALSVAEFLGLRARPWLGLIYLLVGLAAWGVNAVFSDIEIKRAMLRKLNAQEETLGDVQAGVDSLVTGAAPQNPEPVRAAPDADAPY